MRIDWEDNKSHLLLSPQVAEISARDVQLKNLPDLQSHIWLSSSGSFSRNSFKLFSIKKESFLISAQAVCSHLLCTPQDIWLNPLPTFHVGGLAVSARAFVGGFRFVDKRVQPWSAQTFIKDVECSQATLTSLVPTQIFDLVSQGLKVPQSLRGVIVGGGSLSARIYERARQLNWPLLPSYGLTECASQVATASLESLLSDNSRPELQVLKHIRLSVKPDCRLSILSDSLFSGCFEIKGEKREYMPREPGPFLTEDLAQLKEGGLSIIGRGQESRKVKGHLVHLRELKDLVEEIRLDFSPSADMELLFLSHPRKENEVVIVSEGLSCAKKVAKIFNQRVVSHQRIAQIFVLKKLPRNAMEKFIPSWFH